MSTANCPSCGAPVTFAIGSSAVVVCAYCSTLVARTDRGVEDAGKVAALIDTGSPLAVGASGRYREVGFRLTGRTQMRHQAGGVWDEWYAYFDNGAWGWIAEAQGRFYVTFPQDRAAVPLAELKLGERVPSIHPDLVVAEIGRAVVEGAEGELPWRPAPGEAYDYADLTGTGRKFATIDYGEDPPVVYEGLETSLAALGISGGEVRRARVAVTKLSCSNCGAPLELRAPDHAERIFCPSCGSAHDVTHGKLTYLGALKKGKKVEPVIPLGSRGTIDGDEYVVAGFMQRSVKFDIHYYWTEYLLYNQTNGFRWLVHSDEHWSFVTPLRPGEVLDSEPRGAAKRAHWNGREFRLFQDATARVTFVTGEFYWKVSVGEKVDTVDWIRPPEGISKEITREGAQEISYSHARYMTPREVERAFPGVHVSRPSMIGPLQPFRGPRLGAAWALLMLLLLVTAVVIAIAKPRRLVLEKVFDVAAAPETEGAPPNARVFFTDPFELTGKDNVMIEGYSAVDNSWLYASGELVNESTGELNGFELPMERFSGVEDGERWSEGSQRRRAYIGRPDKGRYLLRIETQWQEGRMPPPLHLKVREGVFRFPHMLLAFLALSVPAGLATFFRIRFEAERWKESSHSPFAALQTEDDDE